MGQPESDPSVAVKHLLESRHIRAFVAVARRGSFTQGAKDVFLTQSAVSHAIKSMERDLGCELFRRVGKRALLTEAGERLLQYCEEILHKMHDARVYLRQLPGAGLEMLRIGAPMTVCQHLLPGVLRELQAEFPQTGIRVETGDNPQIIALLLAGRIDIAVMVEPEKRADVVGEPLFSDEMQFIVRPEHPWARPGPVTAEQIRRATLIVANKATRSHQLVTSYFRDRGIRLGSCIEFGSVESIKELVKNELGVGVVASWPMHAELARGELVARPLGPKPLERRWQAVRLRDHTLTGAESTFIARLRAAGESLVRRASEGVARVAVALLGSLAGVSSLLAESPLG
jgi:DNA-binding transcriptional LysR family regulator